MTKHENDIYLIAGRYALVKRINVRKSPMQSTTHGEFRRAGDAPQSEDSFISRLHQFLLGSRTVRLYSRVETNKQAPKIRSNGHSYRVAECDTTSTFIFITVACDVSCQNRDIKPSEKRLMTKSNSTFGSFNLFVFGSIAPMISGKS